MLCRCRWEDVECVRKLLMVGVLVFCGQGSLEQLVLGLFITVVFIMVYSTFKPYEADSNDSLQSLCQFSIFVVLLSALIMKFDESERTSEIITSFLFCCALLPIALALGTVAVEAAGDEQCRALLKRCSSSASRCMRRMVGRPASLPAATSETADDEERPPALGATNAGRAADAAAQNAAIAEAKESQFQCAKCTIDEGELPHTPASRSRRATPRHIPVPRRSVNVGRGEARARHRR